MSPRHRLARALGAAGRQLTPGQWWTASLALVLGVAMLAWGLPGHQAPRSVVSSVPSVVASPEPQTVAPDPLYTTAPPPGRVPGVDAPRPAAGVRSGEATSAPPPATPVRTEVIALVRPEGVAASHSEERMARFFLTSYGISAEVVSVDGDHAAVCEGAAEAGNFAVAGDGLPAALRDCLIERGVRILSYDIRGAAGGSVSTARALDVAFGRLPALLGTVGVVGSTEFRAEVEAGVGGMRRRGTRIGAVAFLDPGAGQAAAIPGAVREFVDAGVETVVFAVAVAQQSLWVGHHSALSPGVGYVVMDAYDAVRNESYPASFDGARAFTVTRVPWYAREHEETPEQEVCRTAYERQAGSTPPPSAETLTRVFQWCQHAALLRVLLSGLAVGRSVPELLAERAIASPLTSDLRTIGERFGPAAQAALEWSAACSCWTQTSGFARR